MLLNKLKKNKGVIFISIISISTVLYLYYYYNNHNVPKVLQPKQELVELEGENEEESEEIVKKSSYIDNKILDNTIKLPSAERKPVDSDQTMVEKIKEYIRRFINPKDVKEIKDFADKKFIKSCLKKSKPLKTLDSPPRYHNEKEIDDCYDKAIRRCNVAPENSTRCYLNECDLSSYNQCTNNVMANQNSCDCRGRELCKLNDQTLNDCYKQTLKDCKKKVKFNV